MTGDAPCKCGRMIYNILLTGYTEPDGEGGTWREVVPGGSCLECGEPLRWLHVPAPEKLVWDFSIIREETNESREGI